MFLTSLPGLAPISPFSPALKALGYCRYAPPGCLYVLLCLPSGSEIASHLHTEDVP